MLNGFERTTAELNSYEKKIIVPLIVNKLLQHKGKKSAIKNKELIAYCYANGIRLLEPRTRKMVEYIRKQRLIDGLIAKQFGYFIAEDPEDILSWVATMESRRNAMDCSIDAAMKVYDKLTITDRQSKHHINQHF